MPTKKQFGRLAVIAFIVTWWTVGNGYGANNIPITSCNLRWFSKDSPWNLRITKNNQAVSASASYVELLYNWGFGINLNTEYWTPVVLNVSGPVRRITITDGTWFINDFPLLDGIFSALTFFKRHGDTDRGFCICDEKKNVFYNIHGMDEFSTENGRSLKYVAAGVFRLDGPGWWDNSLGPWAGRASGASFCGGLVRKKEIEEGLVDHALAVAWPKALIRSPSYSDASVFPAKTSDGEGARHSLPMGSRLQLDPALSAEQLKAFGLSSNDIIIAKAMQQYGAYVVDSSTIMAIYVESALGAANRYGLTGPWPLRLIPYLRVIEPPVSIELDSAPLVGQPFKR